MMASMRTTLATHKMGDDRNQIAGESDGRMRWAVHGDQHVAP